MRHFLFLIILNLFSVFYSYSANNKIDSLESIIKAEKNDTAKINSLISLSREYRNINIVKSKEVATLAITLAGKLQDPLSISGSYNNMGNILRTEGNYSQSLDFHIKAIKISESINDKPGLATGYGGVGEIYRLQNNDTLALRYYLKALEIQQSMNEKRGMSVTFNNIGLIYRSQKNYAMALEFQLKSLEIKKELNDKRGIANSYNNIATIYFKQEQVDKSLEYLLKSLEVREELKDKNGIAMSNTNIGEIYEKKGMFREAIMYHSKSLTIAKETGFKENVKFAYRGLYSSYAKLKDYRKAYEYHQLYSQIKDSLFNEESSKQITEMQTKYDTEKKEKEILLLNKDKEIQGKDLQRQKTIRNAVTGGLLLVVLFSFILINRLLLIRKQKKVIEVEREKSENLLLNILPKETADELKLNNSVKPKFYDQVTVMFTDFKGFTTIAEKMSAEELVSELDFIFKKFDEIISKYPIEKIKTIGDAYMCAGGLPVANTSNPVDVVLAALEICEFMKSRQVAVAIGSKEKGLPLPSASANWQIRIGVHTGSVITGVVGDKKFAYDIWGDTVNVASRMESSGEAGKVNISGETYKMLVGARHALPLRFTFRGKIPAKNKGEIEMYFVEKK